GGLLKKITVIAPFDGAVCGRGADVSSNLKTRRCSANSPNNTGLQPVSNAPWQLFRAPRRARAARAPRMHREGGESGSEQSLVVSRRQGHVTPHLLARLRANRIGRFKRQH
ncbi:hypothetical protein BaRGS_00033957, partial [Batillaria attramentaria]